MYSTKLLLTTIALFFSSFALAQIVSNETELRNAIAAAEPGTTILLADGTWEDVVIEINKIGTTAEPITISALNPGAALMTGTSSVYMEGSDIILSGLVFQDPGTFEENNGRIQSVIELKECNFCKVINNKIDRYNAPESQKELIFKWILNDGLYNEIAYNSFIGKYGIGSIINDNRNSDEPDFLKIHHNYFADRTPINGLNEDNDQDAIRMGSSSSSLSNSFSEVYDNYFYNFFGEAEVISNKAGKNKYYNNTFRNYAGTLTLRHGNECDVYGNYFFAEGNEFSGGIRVIGEGHKIYNNYIEGVNSVKPDGSRSNVTGGINVSNGRLNSELNGYFQVKNAQIVNNTFVDCDYALRIGTMLNSDLDQAPENLIVANNITYNSSEEDYQITTAPIGNSQSEGNIFDLSSDALADDGDFHRPVAGSAPIDAGTGDYPFLTQDILGGNRDVNIDAGAEEFGSTGTNLPYSADDVGLKVGFGAAPVLNATLNVSPSDLTFGKDAETITFDIISNVDWTITEDLSWLDLDINSGSGTMTISATVTENTSGAERTGNISVEEVAGGSNLSGTVSVTQLLTFAPGEIQIVGTTSIGMQDKTGIEEINAYNDDLSNYWTGDPGADPEVSITFDLSCIHELTEIGINFWKADERTTTFSIAVADEAAGPFTLVLDEVESAASGATVETEQLFSLAGTFARYVKFIGIGNSSSSNWTSIANVNIYGNPDCEGASDVFENRLKSNVSIFPIPTTDGILNVSSESEALELIEIFNVSGQKIMTVSGNGAFSKQIDVSKLTQGVYFLKIEKMGQVKFIVK